MQEADLDLDAIGWTEDELAALMAEVPDPEDFEDDEPGSTVSDESEPETKAFRFEFDPTDFAELSQLLTDLRKKYKLDSDAETFEHLVRGAHG